jgi:dTDP-4-amino-4,6-dideoxygalactose transaminase
VFADRGVGRGDLPVTERFCDRLLGLPIGPQLSMDEIDLVIEAVRKALA